MIYTGEHLRAISFPLGGIGTGSIGLRGNGQLFDWEIFNRPDKGSLNGRKSVIKSNFLHKKRRRALALRSFMWRFPEVGES